MTTSSSKRSSRLAKSGSPVVALFAMFVAAGCAGYPPDTPIETPKKAVVLEKVAWASSNLAGMFDTPDYPVSVAATLQSQSFTAHVTGNPFPATPRPESGNALTLKFFSAAGPSFPDLAFDSWTDHVARVDAPFVTDPGYPGKVVAFPQGNYPVGVQYSTVQKDIAYAQVRMQGSSSFYKALGYANLPWKFNNQTSTMVSGPNIARAGLPVWVQSTAQLPTPITYAWKLGGIPQGWNTGFVQTTFPTPGLKLFEVKMTGSNGAQIVRSTAVSVNCPNKIGFIC